MFNAPPKPTHPVHVENNTPFYQVSVEVVGSSAESDGLYPGPCLQDMSRAEVYPDVEHEAVREQNHEHAAVGPVVLLEALGPAACPRITCPRGPARHSSASASR